MPHLMFHQTNPQQTHCICSRNVPLLLPRLLRIAAHNLDLLGCDIVLIIELEVDILDEERPDFVAEAVGIQMTLFVTNTPISPANNLFLRRKKEQPGQALLP